MYINNISQNLTDATDLVYDSIRKLEYCKKWTRDESHDYAQNPEAQRRYVVLYHNLQERQHRLERILSDLEHEELACKRLSELLS